MSMANYDLSIIGGGIIGLVTAMAISAKYPHCKVALFEKEGTLAAHQSSHNSGVIHAGLYYHPSSQKASFCVSGAQALRNFCDENGIIYKRVGKVVIATNQEEIPALEALYQRGLRNQVKGLNIVGPEQLREIEPFARGVKALHCPDTGIVDYEEIAKTYASKAESNGVAIFRNTQLLRTTRSTGKIHLETTIGEFHTNYLINCGGLYADAIARMMGVVPELRIMPFRGEYYTLVPSKHHLIHGLIYPTPDTQFPFLGVHFTKRIHGEIEAGPNAVLAFAQEGYRKRDFNLTELTNNLSFLGFWAMTKRYWKTGLGEFYRSINKQAFARALQKLVPEVQANDLVPAGSGVRAQAVDRSGRLLEDFSIIEARDAIHVLNAPSPAATASLAIGNHIVELASKRFSLNGQGS